MNEIEKKYYNFVEKNKLYSGKHLSYYLKNILFKGVEFKDKKVLDIGAGNGLYSFYALTQGAKILCCIEPELEGSRSGYIKIIKEFANELNVSDNIEIVTDLFQDYTTNDKFDIVLMHYSINHIDEENCVTLESSNKSKEIYSKYFKKLSNLLVKNGDLIVTDVSKYNFFNALGLKSPFAPTIEWEKHQSPYVWKKYLMKEGFSFKRLGWTPTNRLKMIRFLTSNFLFLYLTSSLFLLHMKNRND
jgi:16S rRNA G966 N2-methylase RsmD